MVPKSFTSLLVPVLRKSCSTAPQTVPLTPGSTKTKVTILWLQDQKETAIRLQYLISMAEDVPTVVSSNDLARAESFARTVMATEIPAGICERCEQPNGWIYLDTEHKYLCGPCSETKDAIYTDSYYRYGARCSGADCRTFGVINYRTGDDHRFYCGGSPRCIP